MDKKNWEILKYILISFIIWRVILLFITFYGLNIIPSFSPPNKNPQFPNSKTEYWIKWANWDGGHFLGIAQNGYKNIQAPFFPLYPMLTKLITFQLSPLFGLEFFWPAFVISQVSTVVALFYLYKLVNLDYSHEISKKATFLMLIFPSSYFLVSIYSESLFLALALGAFYYARTNKWLLACILASLSSATRMVGIALIISLGVEFLILKFPSFKIHYLWEKRLNRFFFYAFFLNILLNLYPSLLMAQKNWFLLGLIPSISYLVSLTALGLFLIIILIPFTKSIRWYKLLSNPILFLVFSLSPLLFYMLFLYQSQHNPIAFATEHSNWGRKTTLPYETLINSYNFLSYHGFFKVGVVGQPLLEFVFITFIIFLLLTNINTLRPSYLVYSFLVILMALSTGILLSILRIGLVIFPVIIILANLKNQTLYQSWLIISATMLGILSVFFITSYPVF